MRVGSAESLQGGPGEASGLGAEHRGGEVPEAQQRHTLHLGPSSAPGKLGFRLGG